MLEYIAYTWVCNKMIYKIRGEVDSIGDNTYSLLWDRE